MVVFLTVLVGISQLLLGGLGVYVSLKPPKPERHWYWIGGFAGIGILGVVLTGLIAHQSDIQQAQFARHVEFLERRTDAVNRIVFFVWLDKYYTPEQLGSFRVLLTVLDFEKQPIYLSASESYLSSTKAGPKDLFGSQDTAWSALGDLKFDQMLQDTTVLGNSYASSIGAEAGADHLTFIQIGNSEGADEIDAWSAVKGPYSNVQAFDNTILRVNLSASLWPKVKYIGLVVNNLLLLGQPRKCLTISDSSHAGHPSTYDWPKDRQPPAEMQWVNVVPAGFAPTQLEPMRVTTGFALRFSQYTPWSMDEFLASSSRESLAVPVCDWYAVGGTN